MSESCTLLRTRHEGRAINALYTYIMAYVPVVCSNILGFYRGLIICIYPNAANCNRNLLISNTPIGNCANLWYTRYITTNRGHSTRRSHDGLKDHLSPYGCTPYTFLITTFPCNSFLLRSLQQGHSSPQR